MADIYGMDGKRFAGDDKSGGGSGPEDPMLERRVDILEADMKDVKSSLSRIEVTLASIQATIAQMPKASDFTRLSNEVAEIKGKVSNLPTIWTILGVEIGRAHV